RKPTDLEIANGGAGENRLAMPDEGCRVDPQIPRETLVEVEAGNAHVRRNRCTNAIGFKPRGGMFPYQLMLARLPCRDFLPCRVAWPLRILMCIRICMARATLASPPCSSSQSAKMRRTESSSGFAITCWTKASCFE